MILLKFPPICQILYFEIENVYIEVRTIIVITDFKVPNQFFFFVRKNDNNQYHDYYCETGSWKFV